MYEIIKGFKGCPDPTRLIEYVKGQTFEIGEDWSQELADTAIAEGWAVKAEAKKAAKKKKAKK